MGDCMGKCKGNTTGTAATSCTSTDLNSKNNKFDLETFDLVSEYCIWPYQITVHFFIRGSYLNDNNIPVYVDASANHQH